MKRSAPVLIRGTVRGPHGEPVAGARVYLTRAPVAVPDIAALTDAEGKFTLTAPVPGIYVVECNANGLRARREVAVGQGREEAIEMRLTRD